MKSRFAVALSIAGLVVLLVTTVLLLPGPESAPGGTGGSSGGADEESLTAIVNVRVFDGDSVLESANVLFSDGRGKTLLPGLVDSHVHAIGTARAEAVEFGVTTLLDMFSMPVNLGRMRDQRHGLAPTATVMASVYGGPRTEWLRNHEILAGRLGAMQRQSPAQSFPGSESRASMWANVTFNVGALRAATSTPTRLFGLGKRGCIRPGCRADLVLIDGNPLETIEASARVEGIWKNGYRVPVEQADSSIAPEQAEGTKASPTPAESLDLLADPTRWMAAADDYMGGNSSAAIEWIRPADSPALQVRADVESGFAFPYAGAMWNTTGIPMQPADHSGHRRLVLEIDGPGSDYQSMLFSGEAMGAQPVRAPLPVGRESVIKFGEMGGLDLAKLRAIGVFATSPSDERRFTITRARLE